jgi:hypothetical protein
MCERLSEQTRKARKRHQCVECHGRINPGDQYLIYGMVGDGSAWSIKVHVECDLDAQAADGLRNPYECSDYTLSEWAQDSGVPIDQLGLRDETVSRLREVKRRNDDRHQTRMNAYFSEQPAGRWADDGGRA